VLARIDAALTELGHDPQKLTPEILATVEHLHSGGLATTREQAKRIALTEDSWVLDVGCGIGGPARYLARTYGCRVDGIDLTPELIETGRVLTERSGLADRVVLQISNALDLPYSDQTFDVVWCQNVAMNIADKDGLFAGVYRALKLGGLFTSTEYSVGPGGDIIFPVPWAYDASINFLDREDVMRERYHTAGFRILECMNYSKYRDRALRENAEFAAQADQSAYFRRRRVRATAQLTAQPDRRADHLLDDHCRAP
jgi:sarcosine/dimethylglycine N-methyltransferase